MPRLARVPRSTYGAEQAVSEGRPLDPKRRPRASSRPPPAPYGSAQASNRGNFSSIVNQDTVTNPAANYWTQGSGREYTGIVLHFELDPAQYQNQNQNQYQGQDTPNDHTWLYSLFEEARADRQRQNVLHQSRTESATLSPDSTTDTSEPYEDQDSPNDNAWVCSPLRQEQVYDQQQHIQHQHPPQSTATDPYSTPSPLGQYAGQDLPNDNLRVYSPLRQEYVYAQQQHIQPPYHPQNTDIALYPTTNTPTNDHVNQLPLLDQNIQHQPLPQYTTMVPYIAANLPGQYEDQMLFFQQKLERKRQEGVVFLLPDISTDDALERFMDSMDFAQFDSMIDILCTLEWMYFRYRLLEYNDR